MNVSNPRTIKRPVSPLVEFPSSHPLAINYLTMLAMKVIFLTTAIFSFASASHLVARQSTDTCNASNECISSSGCTGICAPVSSGGGPAVCQDVCVVNGEATSIFCPACYAGDAESSGAACGIDASANCVLL
ncbi:hypothetical protein C8R42DRAFT_682729 [Lentinula raphanica]|nr:hypothetical protein C8R42DRAFT_682729 [Lentinula raphanica]